MARFATIDEAVLEMCAGRMVVVVDDGDRENEGYLTLAAEFVTADAINFMAKFGRGLICLTLTETRADHLRLKPMSAENSSRRGNNFTESIEAREGVTTGISAADRAHTIRVAVDPRSKPSDLARPGHVFPLRARRGGVLVRAGQTEASVDLARLAGATEAGVICEILSDDGSIARLPDLISFCSKHHVLMITVADLIRYRLQRERYIHRVAESKLLTSHGEFRMVAYESAIDEAESHVALVLGVVDGNEPVLVRVHTRSLVEDVFELSTASAQAAGAAPAAGREVIESSLKIIAESGRGALLYLYRNSRGFGIDRTASPHRIVLRCDERFPFYGPNRCPADDNHAGRTLRQVGLGGQILSDLGIHKIRLLTNTPAQVPDLQGFDVEVVEQIPVGRLMHWSERA